MNNFLTNDKKEGTNGAISIFKKNKAIIIVVLITIIALTSFFIYKSKANSNIDPYADIANDKSFSEKCGLKITSVRPGDAVKFPLKISGIADISKYQELGCSWIRFEGQAGTVQVLANINNSGWIPMTTQTPLMADDWMATTTAVHAELLQVLNREIPIGTPLIIRFTEEDVQGSGQYDEMDIPAIFDGLLLGDNSVKELMTISIYVHDLDKINSDCRATTLVTRNIPKTLAVADASLKTLFTYDANSLMPFYNGVTIKNKVAIVDFDSGALQYLNGAACLQGTFKGPIEATLLQYPTIEKVEYSIEGKIWTEWDA